MIHRIVYRFGAVAMSATILGIILYVIVFANSRKCGSTGQDAAEIVRVRYENHLRMAEDGVGR